MQFDIVSSFPKDAAAVITKVLDSDFQRQLYLALGYQDWVEERRAEASGSIERVLRVTPRLEIPALIRKTFGETTAYREFQTWKPDKRSYLWRVEFELSRRVEVFGECSFTSRGENSCSRSISANIKVDVPFVGGKIEDYLRRETIRTQTEAAAALAERLS